MELQHHKDSEEDYLKEDIAETPVRAQFMPVWFGAMNALFIVIGVMALISAGRYLVSYSKLSPDIRVRLISFVFERLLLDAIYVITIIPAAMFLLRRKPAVYWGIFAGVLRISAAIYELVFRPDPDFADISILSLRFGWLICVFIWTLHVYRIRNEWLQAKPGSFFK